MFGWVCWSTDEFRVVDVCFANQVGRSVERFLVRAKGGLNRIQDVWLAIVKHVVNRIQTQTVEMIFVDPEHHVVDHKLTDLVVMLPVKVKRVAPGRAMF